MITLNTIYSSLYDELEELELLIFIEIFNSSTFTCDGKDRDQ